ncbi:MAG TPA: glutathione transferase GstA [Rhizomicrobium sp.]|jgi:glutathione S-transferase|nr:glutathione transferase GstA [Rhizomicrobium sp.]
MKLYYAPGACSLSPHIVAAEAGIALELEKVDLKTHKTERGEDYYAVNPKGYVPALRLDDGNVLTEGPAIVQYLADLRPQAGLAPPNGTLERYRLQEWLHFIGTELHKQFAPIIGGKGSDAAQAEARAKIAKRLEYIDGQLAGRDYLLGATFSAADAYLFVMLTWARLFKIDFASYANVRGFFERVAKRPKVQAALKSEGVLERAA